MSSIVALRDIVKLWTHSKGTNFMENMKLYVFLAQLCGYLGLGVILGYILGEGSSRTAVWVAGLLIFISAIFIGMSLASRSEKPKPQKVDSKAKKDSK